MIDSRATVAFQGRIAPASRARAELDFPAVILSLAHGDLVVTTGSGPDGSRIVLCEDQSQGLRTAMVEADFAILRAVTANFRPALSPFISEPRQSVLDRARALVRVEFATRGAY